jgi:site-specific DNA-methyltransferase (adenine-specific)
MNEILHGDCLNILREMPDGFVDCVYLDPPFFTQKKHSLKSRKLKEYTFDDKWDSLEDYIEFLRDRLIEIKRLMQDHSIIFFHCDKNASHHIRILLDEVFGYENFQSEIIWTYKRWSNSQKNLLPSHQTIFMYSKTQNYKFNVVLQPYSNTTNLDQILQKRVRDTNGKTIYAEDTDGNVILQGPKKGVPLSDTWEIPYLNPKAKERTGYPTQKPLLLLERIIEIATNESDVILDPFCGSGTTLVAAKMSKRQYIGIDVSMDAVGVTKDRLSSLVKSESQLVQKGQEAYDNLPDYVKEQLNGLRVKLVHRNSGFDAIHDLFIENRPILIRIQRRGESLLEAANKLLKAGQKKDAKLLILIEIGTKSNQLLFDDMMPSGVVVLQSFNLQLESLINRYIEQKGKK